MIDLIVYNFHEYFEICEIKNGKKQTIKEIYTYEWEEIIDFINTNYQYARLLLGNCIE